MDRSKALNACCKCEARSTDNAVQGSRDRLSSGGSRALEELTPGRGLKHELSRWRRRWGVPGRRNSRCGQREMGESTDVLEHTRGLGGWAAEVMGDRLEPRGHTQKDLI